MLDQNTDVVISSKSLKNTFIGSGIKSSLSSVIATINQTQIQNRKIKVFFEL